MSPSVNYGPSTLVGNAILALFYNGLRRIPGNRERTLKPRAVYLLQLVSGVFPSTLYMEHIYWRGGEGTDRPRRSMSTSAARPCMCVTHESNRRWVGPGPVVFVRPSDRPRPGGRPRASSLRPSDRPRPGARRLSKVSIEWCPWLAI